MARYGDDFKYSIVSKMMPPLNQSIPKIARETGLSLSTLYLWQKQAKSKGLPVPGGEIATERWSTQDKFNIVIETSRFSEIELAEYCRSKGLYVEQVVAWKDACMQANGGVAKEATRLQQELRQKDRELKSMEKALRRKEAALAETAAILVLRKKAEAIWGDNEDE